MSAPLLLVAWLAAAPQGPTRAKVAIPEIEITDKTLAVDRAALTELFSSALADPDVLDVITARDVAAMLQYERTRQLAGCADTDTSCLAELFGGLGMELLATASIGRVGESFVISARLMDVRKSTSVYRKSLTVAGSEKLAGALEQLGREMRDAYRGTIGKAARGTSSSSAPRIGVRAALVSNPLARTIGGELGATVELGPLRLMAAGTVARFPALRLGIGTTLLTPTKRVAVVASARGLWAPTFTGGAVFGGGVSAGVRWTAVGPVTLTAELAGEVLRAPRATVFAPLLLLGGEVRVF